MEKVTASLPCSGALDKNPIECNPGHTGSTCGIPEQGSRAVGGEVNSSFPGVSAYTPPCPAKGGER